MNFMSEGIIQAFREMDEPSYLTSETPGVHHNMVRCALFPEMEFSDRDELTRVLTGWNQADEHRLRGLIWTLVGGSRFLELVSENTSKQRLIEIYVSELFSPRARQPREGSPSSVGSRQIRRRQREFERYDEMVQNQRRLEIEGMELEAEEILEGRPDRSIELRNVMKDEKWDCSICFDSFEDPNRIYVTCHAIENDNREYVQHKACDCGSLTLRTCHICRAPARRLPLSRAWNGVTPLAMQMGGNEYLVGVS
jgi:hypothetical protein